MDEILNGGNFWVYVAGWTITILCSASTLLYKGIWKRVNQIAAEVDQIHGKLERLIGAHNATHKEKL